MYTKHKHTECVRYRYVGKVVRIRHQRLQFWPITTKFWEETHINLLLASIDSIIKLIYKMNSPIIFLLAACLLIAASAFNLPSLPFAMTRKLFTKKILHSTTNNLIPVVTPNSKPKSDTLNIPADSSSASLQELYDSSFEDLIGNKDRLSLVLFGAEWCTPCKHMGAALLNSSMKLNSSSNAEFYHIDTDYNPITAATYGIRSIPTVLIFQSGKVVAEIVGAVPPSVIESQIIKHSNTQHNADHHNSDSFQ